MKAIKLSLLAIAIFISSLTYGLAQDTLKINANALDSVLGSVHAIGDTVNVGIWVYNPMNVAFNNTIEFNYTIVTGGVVQTYNTGSSTDTSGITGTFHNPVMVPAHDSTLLNSLHIVFAGPDFVNGSSTVVIWPTIQNGDTLLTDSASTTVIVSYPAGISSPDAENIKVYMSGQELFIRNNSKNSFGDIRIYDLTGALLTEQKVSQSAEIPMRPYAPGVYLVELTLADGSRGVYKVFNAPSR